MLRPDIATILVDQLERLREEYETHIRLRDSASIVAPIDDHDRRRIERAVMRHAGAADIVGIKINTVRETAHALGLTLHVSRETKRRRDQVRKQRAS